VPLLSVDFLCHFWSGLLTILAKSIGDTFTDTFNVVTRHISNFTVFKSSVCEDYYFVKHDRGSNEYTDNIIKNFKI